MTNTEVVVLGSANVDTSLSVTKLPTAGQTVLASSLRRSIGGKGVNQAVAAARAGASTAIVAGVGDDEDGAAIRRLLAAEGISTACVRTVQEPTGTAVVIIDELAENTIVVAPLANHALIGLSPDDDALLEACAVLLCQLEVPLETVTAALRRAHRNGARTVLNAAPATVLPAGMVGQIDVLVVNEGEARTVAGGLRDAPTSTVIDRLLTVAPEVIVTRGANGADYAARDGGLWHIPALEVDALDTTGAGDAFCGALCAALVRGQRTLDALQVGVAAGAWSVQRLGTIESMPTAADLNGAHVATPRVIAR